MLGTSEERWVGSFQPRLLREGLGGEDGACEEVLRESNIARAGLKHHV